MIPGDSEASAVAAWAASGAMALTGCTDRPALGPPRHLPAQLRRLGERLRRRSEALGDIVGLDPLALLGERAAIAGLARQGQTSCGGGTRLLRCSDGWLAATLARSEDRDLLGAWLGVDARDDPWAEVADAVARRSAATVAADGTRLGLPVAALPQRVPARPTSRWRHLGTSAPIDRLAGVVVADLSSLWAGPLAGSLLAGAGADVVKVESLGRPDGARSGPVALFDLLNGGKRSVALDLAAPEGRRALLSLLASVDVVIEGSRPRALEQLGIDRIELLSSAAPRVWVTLTGHGTTDSERDRAGFGDDAAVAGALVCWDDTEPVFCADAVADPATGLAVAVAALDALAAGGRWWIDASLAGVARSLAGPTLPVPQSVIAAPPRHRPVGRPGPVLGADTDDVLARLGVRW